MPAARADRQRAADAASKPARIASLQTLFDIAPERVRLSRAAGWRIPANTVSVARPHRYGNPFIVGTPENGGNLSRAQAVDAFRLALHEGRLQFSEAEVRRELAGKNLACWCSLDVACHADVLLDVANSGRRLSTSSTSQGLRSPDGTTL